MEYRTDKRTKNLTLRDIHVGDWVQVWSDITERYSPPLKIIQICDDGTIYLVTDDEERCTPWEENIKDVDALPIDVDVLKGFGFAVTRQVLDEPCLEYFVVRIGSIMIGELCLTNIIDTQTYDLIVKRDLFRCGNFQYMHELVNYMQIYYSDIKLEWKGAEK